MTAMNSLPSSWVDRIFDKLNLTYGRDFMDRWEGVDIDLVKADWALELGGFVRFPEGIGYALQNLPAGKAPSVQDFKALAKRAPLPEHKALPLPAANPEVVASTLAAVSKVVKSPLRGKTDWARQILCEHQSGMKVNPTRLKFARAALGGEA